MLFAVDEPGLFIRIIGFALNYFISVTFKLNEQESTTKIILSALTTQVPVRVAGGLLFELLGQSAGDPNVEEDDIPVVLRSWQAQNFLVTALHVKGYAANINILGVSEVQVFLCNYHFIWFCWSW